MSHRTAVWITGVGAVTPLGHAYHTIADNLLAGLRGEPLPNWVNPEVGEKRRK